MLLYGFRAKFPGAGPTCVQNFLGLAQRLKTRKGTVSIFQSFHCYSIFINRLSSGFENHNFNRLNQKLVKKNTHFLHNYCSVGGLNRVKRFRQKKIVKIKSEICSSACWNVIFTCVSCQNSGQNHLGSKFIYISRIKSK